MRRFFRPFCLLFTAAMFMASCLNSDNDTVTYYDDAAITAFSLSNAKITRHTKSSTGEDSTYIEISSDVANYPFVIDQIKGEIYNVDSLPLGTDPTKILCNYSTKNNSYAGIKSLKSDSIAYFNTADSIDFSSPREVSVYSSSGVNVKKYKITVNIHKEKADSFVWKQMPDSRELASLKDMKAYNLNGEIVVLGTDGQKTRVLTINASNGRTFTDTRITLETNSYNNAVVFNNELYVIDNGTLKTSKDAKSYDIVTDSPEVIQLLAASSKAIYGKTAENIIFYSTDKGKTWIEDTMDSDGKNLPTEDISYTCYQYGKNKDEETIVLFGIRPEISTMDNTATIWRKIIENNDYSEGNEWTYINYDSKSKKTLPRLENLNVVRHNDMLMALGGKGLDGCYVGAFSKIYISYDHGYSWNSLDYITYPYGFDKSASAVSVCTDSDNYIWIMLNHTGQVWKGRINKMSWNR